MTAWLLTWLWQGTALSVSLWVALSMLPRINAATRYVLWWGAFAALIFLGWQSLPGPSPVGTAASAAVVSSGSGLAIQVQPLPARALSMIAMMWTSVALFLLLRIGPGLNALYRLKDECRPFPSGVEQHLPLWREASGRRARLALCDRLPGAAVLGLHEPCIAIPSTMVSELSVVDLDQIILHEYGHVQRRDDWMRLLQALLEAALWMHPATFLIGRELNLEREVACDDWVIARTRAPQVYARCLSRIAEQRRALTPAFVQPLFGGNRGLIRRIDRLLDLKRNARRNASLPAGALGALAIAACAIQLRAFPLVSDAVVPFAPLVAASAVEPVVEPVVEPAVEPVVSGFSRTFTDRAVRLKADTTDKPVRPNVDTIEKPVRPRADSAGKSVRLAADMTAKTIHGNADATEKLTAVEKPDDLLIGATQEMFPPVLHATRVFHGVYQSPDRAREGPAAAARVTTPWELAGDAGVGIGTATRKASIGLANTLTRAGTALARSF